ncbi:rho guanine nucleotide exchange factor 28 isoform X2 [Xenopus laevis]|uniref:Rho guanine nucleotide exchange factor 28 n=1 Tax=Xenopus laevis TaxID=8355 RepID=A0A8J1M409_XENLA|nr:rho guanine nucleotide exchange factor 28 isoform X2 [Xenopus laevis]
MHKVKVVRHKDVKMMELSLSTVPLYGQMTVFATFGQDLHLPEDAEFYFVYNGSSQRHTVFAERLSSNVLRSVFPGHNCPEPVIVTVCMHTEGYSPVIVACTPVTYVRDPACNISHYLKLHCGSLSPTSHETILTHFGVTVKDLLRMDRNMMLCLASEELKPTWNILGSASEADSFCGETLLHLTARWGLEEVFHFLLCQPGGVSALQRENEDRETPIDIAVRSGHTGLVACLRNFQDSPPLDSFTIAIEENYFLRFFHSTTVQTLTLIQPQGKSLESDIELFRKCLWDTHFIKKITSPMQNPDHKIHNQADEIQREEDKRYSSIDVLKRLKHPPTFLAASRLSAMLNGSDEVYANSMVVDEVTDSEINYIHLDNANVEGSPTDRSDSTLTADKTNNYSVCASPERNRAEENNVDEADLPAFLSPSQLYSGAAPRQSRTLAGYAAERSKVIKRRSSSLDGLDADSEGEGTYPRYSAGSSFKQDSTALLGNSGDELDSPERNAEPDFPIRGLGTLPLRGKDSLITGVRLRSYSCSSPKLSVGISRLGRDHSVDDTSEDGVVSFSGRSLLQALTLSKSVYLLHPGKQRAYSLPDQLREKRLTTTELYFARIEEEEWDKYTTPAKPESEKNKVSRTFSFLRNRMSSTRNKSKVKNKDMKEKLNRHQFVMGTFSGVVPCMVCEKALLGKESLQCSSCNVNVHKGCKESTPACTKRFQERYHPKSKQAAVITNSSYKDIPQPVQPTMHISTSVPLGLSSGKKETTHSTPLQSKNIPVLGIDRRSDPSLESDGDTSGSRSRSQSEELLQTLGTTPSMDCFTIEDVVDTTLWSDFSNDMQEFEAESWSLVVDPLFCEKQKKDVIKRQDVIFELIQTELHHVQTLLIMSEIFRKGMKEELQLDHSTVDKIFPCLDELLEIHKQFFSGMKERKQESREGNDKNFIIRRIGDILVQQFSADNGSKMKKIYGEFCSHHIEALSLFKELQQNKKFQNFIKLRNRNLLARRRGIPECILLVTQRITKYPVLVERILKYTTEGTEEHTDLCKALGLMKELLGAVDLRVNEFEKGQKLLEILNKIENKTYTKLKNGLEFRKQDLTSKGRALLREGLVFWKTATGRLKDIQALLLTDILLFLQEKDQKYVFATVDQKPPVICLRKLIVREVANEERGMFLISASSAGPEMYEIHTSSKEERNAWMRQIQEAVQSCPQEDEGKSCESDEDKRVAEARTVKAQKYQDTLTLHDQNICNTLEEKLQIYAELAALNAKSDMHLEPHLFIKADSGEIPQATALLATALKEAENLYATVKSQMDNPCWSPDYESKLRRSRSAETLDEELETSYHSQSPEAGERRKLSYDANISHVKSDRDLAYTEENVLQEVHNLTRLLYSIQATVAMQDSHIELHKALLQDYELGNRCSPGSRGSVLNEHEKYRNLEKHRIEMANLHKLQQQFNQEQQRWLRECDQKQRETEEKEDMLQQKEHECQSQEQFVHQKREELDQQQQEFQQNLERLQEGHRFVEREREDLAVKLNLWKHLNHHQPRSLLTEEQGVGSGRSVSLQDEDSVNINSALAGISLNTITTFPAPDYPNAHLFHNSSSHLAQSTEKNTMDTANEPWSSVVSRHQRLEGSSHISRHKDACNNDLNAAHVISCGALLSPPNAAEPTEPLTKTAEDTSHPLENGKIEENVVYL